jgi:hypothetical protein
MGLDMYAYSSARAGQYTEFWQSAELQDDKEFTSTVVSRPVEIAYWRKHPNLHGWMERLWYHRCRESGQNIDEDSFNGIELELTREDLDNLEHDVTNNLLPGTTGFFFGSDSDDYYREKDLAFVRRARADLFLGLRVFYNSSW